MWPIGLQRHDAVHDDQYAWRTRGPVRVHGTLDWEETVTLFSILIVILVVVLIIYFVRRM